MTRWHGSITPSEPPNLRRVATMLAVTMAESDTANRFGERYGNNGGADIIRMRANDGTGLPADSGGPWCASYLSWVFRRAAEDTSYANNFDPNKPFELWFDPSRGAKKLVDNAARSGRKITNWRDIERGDLILRRRDGGHHVMLATASYDVSRDAIPMVDGNRGKFPAIVDLDYVKPGVIRYAARPY